MKYHVLLIEDNDDIRENTADILELANYNVTTASNGKEGVEKALDVKPDIIVCDVMMPVLDGYGVLHLLQKNEELAHVPFIFLTAKADRSDFRKGMEMGADDYISKPFTDIELLNAIEKRLQKNDHIQKASHRVHDSIYALVESMDDAEALKTLIALRSEVNYKKKSTIYTIGQHPQKLFYIQNGKVKTYLTNDDGKDFTVGLYGPGEFFGYTAILEDGLYKESAETLDESLIVEIPIEEFVKTMKQQHSIAHHFIKMLANDVTEKEQRLLNIAYNSLRKRVANALIQLKNKYQEDENGLFTIQISREDLSNIAGTATESLIRTLGDFKQEGLVKVNGSKITILNASKLESMLN